MHPLYQKVEMKMNFREKFFQKDDWDRNCKKILPRLLKVLHGQPDIYALMKINYTELIF